MLQLMPVTDGKHSDHTTLSFEVTDIERTVQDMESKGVRFQDYDLPDLKTDHHICSTDAEKCAWFMDTENNILCVHERLGTQAEYQLRSATPSQVPKPSSHLVSEGLVLTGGR